MKGHYVEAAVGGPPFADTANGFANEACDAVGFVDVGIA